MGLCFWPLPPLQWAHLPENSQKAVLADCVPSSSSSCSDWGQRSHEAPRGAVLSFQPTSRGGGWETETARSVAGPPWYSAQVLCGEARCWQPPMFWGGGSLLPAHPTLPSLPWPPILSPPAEVCPGGKAAGGLLPHTSTGFLCSPDSPEGLHFPPTETDLHSPSRSLWRSLSEQLKTFPFDVIYGSQEAPPPQPSWIELISAGL